MLPRGVGRGRKRPRGVAGAQPQGRRTAELRRAAPVLSPLALQDGHGLRDEYKISGPELESMCDLVRTVPGVLGERMLGGGDKGAAGALVKASAVQAVKRAVALGYPRCHPDFADKYAVHVCKLVDGVTVLKGLV